MKLKYRIKRFFSRFKYQKGDWVLFYYNITNSNVEGKIEQCTFDLNNRKVYLVKIEYWHEYVAEGEIIKKIE